MLREATIHIDGAARGNPGPAAYAVVITEQGKTAVEESKTIGNLTNNVAEYTALVRALELALEIGLQSIQVFSDSELLVKQMNGEYRVKHPDLILLYQDASRLRKRLPNVTITHVRREQNKRADELCNIALDANKPKAANAPAKPKSLVGDAVVRADAILCLQAAAQSWATNGAQHPPPAHVWDQLWSILEEGGVLRKVKS